MKKQPLPTTVLNHASKNALFLLSLLLLLAACTFRSPEATSSSLKEDTTGCLASQSQVSLRDCLTAVYSARLVDAYTLGQLH
jgi:hypothetical protein